MVEWSSSACMVDLGWWLSVVKGGEQRQISSLGVHSDPVIMARVNNT